MRLAARAVVTGLSVAALAATGLVVAVPAAAAPPSAPTGVSVVVATANVPENNGRFTVSWQPVTGALAYRVEVKIGTSLRSSATVSAPATSAVLDGLVGGIRYSVTVKAANADGYGAASTATDATALTVTSEVSVTNVEVGDDTLLVSWNPPSQTGGAPVQRYRVEQNVAGDVFTTLNDNIDPSQTSLLVLTGTEKQATTDYRVSADNGYGWSASAPAVLEPDAPRSLASSVSGTSVTATWSAPLVGDDQLPISGYLVQIFGPGSDDSDTTAGLTYTFSNLASGSYTLTVSAADIQQNLGPSAATVFTIAGSPGPGPSPDPGATPGPPTGVAAVAGDASATVTWVAPEQSGSFAISSYRVTSSPAGGSCISATTSCTVSGLTNGTTYTFTVAALNGAGYGEESAPSNAVTPEGSPSPEPTPTPTPSPTPSPSPEPTPTPDIEMPARIGVERGVPARVVLTTEERVRVSTLTAYVVVKGKRRNLGATFRAQRGGDIVMRFTVDRKPGRYEILLGQVMDGKVTILDRSRLIVKRGRRAGE